MNKVKKQEQEKLTPEQKTNGFIQTRIDNDDNKMYILSIRVHNNNNNGTANNEMGKYLMNVGCTSITGQTTGTCWITPNNFDEKSLWDKLNDICNKRDVRIHYHLFASTFKSSFEFSKGVDKKKTLDVPTNNMDPEEIYYQGEHDEDDPNVQGLKNLKLNQN